MSEFFGGWCSKESGGFPEAAQVSEPLCYWRVQLEVILDIGIIQCSPALSATGLKLHSAFMQAIVIHPIWTRHAKFEARFDQVFHGKQGYFVGCVAPGRRFAEAPDFIT